MKGRPVSIISRGSPKNKKILEGLKMEFLCEKHSKKDIGTYIEQFNRIGSDAAAAFSLIEDKPGNISALEIMRDSDLFRYCLVKYILSCSGMTLRLIYRFMLPFMRKDLKKGRNCTHEND